EGTLARWKLVEGQAFKAGSVLCEIETDKATMDYEAPKDGVLLKALLAQGSRAAVGDVIGIIGKAGENPDALLAELSTAVAPYRSGGVFEPVTEVVRSSGAAPLDGAPLGPAPHDDAPPSSPLARRLAAALGLDIRTVRGTGPGGRVIQRDVEASAVRPPAANAPAVDRSKPGPVPGRPAPEPRARSGEPAVRVEPVTGKRAVIARRLSESFFTAPHYYLKRTVDAERLLSLRETLTGSDGRKPSLNAFLARLTGAALARHPAVNAGWKDDGQGGAVIEYRARVDIGLAVALPDGLITPVVRDCGSRGIADIDAEMAALVLRARGPGLAPEEYTGATFTISNLGGFGVEEFTAIINPPGSAILAVGAVLPEPASMPDGTVSVRRRIRLTLGCDHRVIDGAVGAAFLRDLAEMIEEPARALM
ncbi:MAG TPA: dihydrolipoamide acetyltransferase family protein, partial [Magnetospirillaceae bacterium]|nr:dihydrolipoamide acetyltransferase family protein [Magnetospirillaceae bacterium]